MKKLLILDGNSVLHRAYYALPDWRNRSGEATAGVYGFLSMLIKAVEDLEPTHIIIVFDHPSPTFRHTMYVGYQTNREKDRQISDDIWGQVDKLKIVFDKMQVPVFQVSGFEADDIIGTLCKNADKFDQVIVITGDRDLMQLVTEKVRLYMPLKGLSDTAIVDAEKVLERMKVRPDQIIDYKGLVGDSSDNYPGVAGIGPKTAEGLLRTFGTLNKIYENLDTVPEAIKNKLANGHESAILSQNLATIKTDVPLHIDWEKSSIPDTEKIIEVLKELGHKSLVKRAGGEPDKDTNQPGLFDQ